MESVTSECNLSSLDLQRDGDKLVALGNFTMVDRELPLDSVLNHLVTQDRLWEAVQWISALATGPYDEPLIQVRATSMQVTTTIALNDSEHTECIATIVGNEQSLNKFFSMGNATLNSSDGLPELLSWVHTSVAASLLATSSLRRSLVSPYGPYFS